jgi:alkylated DNA repair dioxygenase AlkB
MSIVYIPDFVNHNRFVESKRHLSDRNLGTPALTADEMFVTLWNELNWERRPDAPRREYWTNVYDRSYTYGRGAGTRTYDAQPITREILTVSESLNQDPRVSTFFEGCFLNGYEDARDWLGWHEDDDPGIDHSKPIAVVTLYGGPGVDKPRSIQFREKLGEVDGKPTYGEIIDQPLEHGSLCLMPAGFQSTYQHRIPKAGFESKARISLTFRSLL